MSDTTTTESEPCVQCGTPFVPVHSAEPVTVNGWYGSYQVVWRTPDGTLRKGPEFWRHGPYCPRCIEAMYADWDREFAEQLQTDEHNSKQEQTS